MTDTFYEKIKTKIGNMVKVKTDLGKTIIGRLAAYNQYDGSIILEEAYEKGKYYPSIIINGTALAQIYFLEEKTEKHNLENEIKSLLKTNPSLSINEIAKILNTKPEEIKPFLKKRNIKKPNKKSHEK